MKDVCELRLGRSGQGASFDAPCRKCAVRVAELEATVAALRQELATAPPAPWVWLIYAYLRRAKDGRRNNGGARAGSGRKPNGGKLLRAVSARVPAHLPADVREDVIQSIAVDVLSGVVRVEGLDARAVRRYVRAAYGLRDSFRFRSLDAPVGEEGGRTFGELLAA